jgi:hypothetical protein
MIDITLQKPTPSTEQSGPVWWLYRKLQTIEPRTLTAYLSLAGLAMCVLSYPLGLAYWTSPDQHEAGYLTAINWSVDYLLVFPMCAWFCLGCLHAMPGLVDQLERRKMLVQVVGSRALCADRQACDWLRQEWRNARPISFGCGRCF